MAAWPSVFKHLTAKQAWRYVHSGDMILSELSKAAKKELAALSAWGKSRGPVQLLSSDIAIFTKTKHDLCEWDTEHVQSGLRKLKVTDPEENSGIPGYDPWRE